MLHMRSFSLAGQSRMVSTVSSLTLSRLAPDSSQRRLGSYMRQVRLSSGRYMCLSTSVCRHLLLRMSHTCHHSSISSRSMCSTWFQVTCQSLMFPRKQAVEQLEACRGCLIMAGVYMQVCSCP